MMHNYLLESDKLSSKPDRELFQLVFRRFLGTQASPQEAIECILRPIARAVAFVHEVSSGKWVMHGLFIGNIPSLLYSV